MPFRMRLSTFLVFLIILVVIALCGVVGLLSKMDQGGVLNVPAIVTKEPGTTPRPGTIRAGMWQVGVDVKVGKYKTDGAVDVESPLCYWDVKNSNGDIIAQGVKAGSDEQGMVTLKANQTFETSGCKEWYAVK